MALNSWLPAGFALPGSASSRLALFEGPNWQILETRGGGRASIVRDGLVRRWLGAGLLDAGACQGFTFENERLWSILCARGQFLCPVAKGDAPTTKAESLAFALALRATRSIDSESALQDAVFVEKTNRLLPTYGVTPTIPDDVVLGSWLTGGEDISAKSFRRLSAKLSWLGASHLRDVIQAAGFDLPTDCKDANQSAPFHQELGEGRNRLGSFELAGRPALAAFFNEHVVDILKHSDRYGRLALTFLRPLFCMVHRVVAKRLQSIGWSSFSGGLVLRSTRRALLVATSTKRARRSRPFSTKQWNRAVDAGD